MLVTHVSAEILASTDLVDVCEWLIERQHDPMHLRSDHLPALGRHTRLRVARPITARRAVLCTMWLLDDADGGDCLVAGTLRFVSHPNGSDVRVRFEGLTIRTGRGRDLAHQLLELIASSVRTNDASLPDSMSAAG
jgi:hypothetical protein